MKQKVILYKGEDGYFVVECPSLPGCISQGKTAQEATKNIKEAISCYVHALEKDGLPVPKERCVFDMNQFPVCSAEVCVKILSKAGFYVKHQEKNFVTLRRDNPFGQVVFSNSEELDRITLKVIIRQSGLSIEEFWKLLPRLKKNILI